MNCFNCKNFRIYQGDRVTPDDFECVGEPTEEDIVKYFEDNGDFTKENPCSGFEEEEEGCEYCVHRIKLYVPPIEAYKDIPKDAYVCDFFLKESGRVQYNGKGYGMCECFTPKEKKKDVKGQMNIYEYLAEGD